MKIKIYHYYAACQNNENKGPVISRIFHKTTQSNIKQETHKDP